MALYLYAINGYSLCPPLPWRDRVFTLGQFASHCVGFGGSNFAVFAPYVGHMNIRLYALVRDDNGRARVWRYPCIEQWSLVGRQFNDRFRKYSEIFRVSEGITRGNLALWLDLVRYIARSCDCAVYHPSSIFLMRHAEMIPVVDYAADNTQQRLIDRVAGQREDGIVFSYCVDAKDLE